jgi:hypothetical protein
VFLYILLPSAPKKNHLQLDFCKFNFFFITIRVFSQFSFFLNKAMVAKWCRQPSEKQYLKFLGRGEYQDIYNDEDGRFQRQVLLPRSTFFNIRHFTIANFWNYRLTFGADCKSRTRLACLLLIVAITHIAEQINWNLSRHFTSVRQIGLSL